MKLKQLVFFVFLILIFLALLTSIYLVHINFFEVNVIFYSALLDGVIASILVASLLFLSKVAVFYTVFERVLISLSFLLGSYIIAISVPTVIDRSLSFYLLEKIQEAGGGVQLSKMEDLFVREYLKDYKVIDLRLTEQKESGTVTIVNGCVKLTSVGEETADFSRLFRHNFLAKKRLISGIYTDSLTVPRESSNDFIRYYGCKGK